VQTLTRLRAILVPLETVPLETVPLETVPRQKPVR
jgi:hypothetical protein